MEKTTIKLNPDYIEKIKNDPELQGKIAGATMKSVDTVQRWCRTNAVQLTMLSVLNAIRDYYKLPKHTQLTITEPVQADKVAA